MSGGSSTNNPVPNFYRASADDFKKIPGSPIAYWVSEKVNEIFANYKPVSYFAEGKEGLKTGNNDLYLRYWYEINSAMNGNWVYIVKGGSFRKWYGNKEYVVYWKGNGKKLSEVENSNIPNRKYLFKKYLTWSNLSSSCFSMRFVSDDCLFETKSSALFFTENIEINELLAYFNSKVASNILGMLAPTLDFKIGPVTSIPYNIICNSSIIENTNEAISLSKSDWDSYETSWDFTTLPLLRPEYRGHTLEETYATLRTHWRETTLKMQRLEEENNRIFIEAYGLEEELTPDVPLSEITLTCNPHYRYNRNKTEEELDALLLTDTVKEFISYAVGCMFGRYSPDTPGLVLANQGEGMADFSAKVPNPSFLPDDDNIIPILDDEYFTDDIVTRFREFLKVTFGNETLAENLAFIAKALSGKSSGSPENVIRNYFLKQFYKDHLKMYKKRPIYWFFSSGKKQGFNALIYMHRYDKSTLAKMRTDYLLELESRLDAAISILSDDAPKNKKRITKLRSQIDEIKTYDELLNNKALSLIEIDLDDGVVVNYAKFEGLVKKI